MNVPSTFCTRAFGHPGLDVTDGSVMLANPGGNPSLLITALAERAKSLWPNKGEPDRRPPLGSGYVRIDPVMPRRQSCPRALTASRDSTRRNPTSSPNIPIE